jgi:pentatricopeptide repeat protein
VDVSKTIIIFTSVLCNHLRILKYVHFCSQSGNMDRVEELVRQMEEGGIDSPIDVYHSMMHGYTIIQDEKRCLIVFERLKV